jgi:hypothetical protein
LLSLIWNMKLYVAWNLQERTPLSILPAGHY